MSIFSTDKEFKITLYSVDKNNPELLKKLKAILITDFGLDIPTILDVLNNTPCEIYRSSDIDEVTKKNIKLIEILADSKIENAEYDSKSSDISSDNSSANSNEHPSTLSASSTLSSLTLETSNTNDHKEKKLVDTIRLLANEKTKNDINKDTKSVDNINPTTIETKEEEPLFKKVTENSSIQESVSISEMASSTEMSSQKNEDNDLSKNKLKLTDEDESAGYFGSTTVTDEVPVFVMPDESNLSKKDKLIKFYYKHQTEANKVLEMIPALIIATALLFFINYMLLIAPAYENQADLHMQIQNAKIKSPSSHLVNFEVTKKRKNIEYTGKLTTYGNKITYLNIEVKFKEQFTPTSQDILLNRNLKTSFKTFKIDSSVPIFFDKIQKKYLATTKANITFEKAYKTYNTFADAQIIGIVRPKRKAIDFKIISFLNNDPNKISTTRGRMSEINGSNIAFVFKDTFRFYNFSKPQKPIK